MLLTVLTIFQSSICSGVQFLAAIFFSSFKKHRNFGNVIFQILVVVKIIMDLIFFLQVKRYAEMSRKLRFFHDQVAKAGKLAYRPIMENVTDLDELDHKLGDLESELLEINANNDKLQSSQSELTELKLVLQNVSFTLPFVL
jgi:V-type H+-transporting ATPase subunit a